MPVADMSSASIACRGMPVADMSSASIACRGMPVADMSSASIACRACRVLSRAGRPGLRYLIYLLAGRDADCLAK
jgi:hypothetical protein